jgi:hypothetical protein
MGSHIARCPHGLPGNSRMQEFKKQQSSRTMSTNRDQVPSEVDDNEQVEDG